MQPLKVIIFLSILSFILGNILIYHTILNKIDISARDVIVRAKADIRFNGKEWDVARYINDPFVRGLEPMYIITNDGYVIDRRQIIHGFLDLSNYKYLLTFTTPQTIKTITNQRWRVVSKPLVKDGINKGVIGTAYYDPGIDDLENIDAQLQKYLEELSKRISYKSKGIEFSRVDDSSFPQRVSFTVVDEFNSIIVKKQNSSNIDRAPNFIDPSYIKPIIASGPRVFFKYDSVTHELFRVETDIIRGPQNNIAAVIAVGRSVNFALIIMLYFSILQGTIIIVGIVLQIVSQYRSVLVPSEQDDFELPKSILFDEKKSVLSLDAQEIPIPFDTNQYYLIKALFSKPEKIWETDELLEFIGQDPTEAHWRKIYDTMIILNKKITVLNREKLILNKGKRYMLNPVLLNSISKS